MMPLADVVAALKLTRFKWRLKLHPGVDHVYYSGRHIVLVYRKYACSVFTNIVPDDQCFVQICLHFCF